MGWDFKTLDKNGELADLTEEQEIRKHLYTQVLEVAKESKATNPLFSKFHVKGAIGNCYGIYQTGNSEYGCCQALHCEESAMAIWNSQGVRPVNPVLGFITNSPAGPAAPCGNCRDIMRDNIRNKLELISGNANGGLAVVASLGSFLFDDFKRFGFDNTYKESMKFPIKDMVERCQKFKFDVYAPEDVNPERNYVVAIKGKKDWYYGALRLRCEFHPTYPLERAVMQAEENNDPDIQQVWIACEDHIPDVMYRDRQNLFELNLDNQLLLMNPDINPTVYLFNYSSKPWRINETRITTVKEWLPMPFSPREFGTFINTDLIPYLDKKYGGW